MLEIAEIVNTIGMRDTFNGCKNQLTQIFISMSSDY